MNGGANGVSGSGDVPMRTSSERRRLLGAAAVAAIGVFLLFTRVACGPSDSSGGFDERSRQVAAAGAVVGALVRAEQQDPHVLLLVEPENSPERRAVLVEAAVSGLRRGLGDGAEITVDFPVLGEEKRERLAADAGVPERIVSRWAPPLEHWFSYDEFRSLAEEHASATVLVSLIGLPLGFDRVLFSEFFENRPTVLLFGALGDRLLAEEVLRAGRLLAAVGYTPCAGAALPLDTPDDAAALFAETCCLVTADGGQRMLEEFPEAVAE